MEMTTIKALAKQQNVTYQAIWKLVVKYESDLSGHIVTKGKIRYLDDYAVDFIMQKRRDHPMVALYDDQSAIIESLRAEKEALQNEVFRLQNEVIAEKDQLSKLQAENNNLLEAKIRNEYLLEDKNRLQGDVDRLRDETDRLRAEVDSFKPSFFGLYRKKK